MKNLIKRWLAPQFDELNNSIKLIEKAICKLEDKLEYVEHRFKSTAKACGNELREMESELQYVKWGLENGDYLDLKDYETENEKAWERLDEVEGDVMKHQDRLDVLEEKANHLLKYNGLWRHYG